MPVGVGNGLPTGPDSASVVIDYYDSDPRPDVVKRGNSTLYGDLQIDEAVESTTIEFTVETRHQVTGEAPETETGSAAIRRMYLES